MKQAESTSKDDDNNGKDDDNDDKPTSSLLSDLLPPLPPPTDEEVWKDISQQDFWTSGRLDLSHNNVMSFSASSSSSSLLNDYDDWATSRDSQLVWQMLDSYKVAEWPISNNQNNNAALWNKSSSDASFMNRITAFFNDNDDAYDVLLQTLLHPAVSLSEVGKRRNDKKDDDDDDEEEEEEKSTTMTTTSLQRSYKAAMLLAQDVGHLVARQQQEAQKSSSSSSSKKTTTTTTTSSRCILNTTRLQALIPQLLAAHQETRDASCSKNTVTTRPYLPHVSHVLRTLLESGATATAATTMSLSLATVSHKNHQKPLGFTQMVLNLTAMAAAPKDGGDDNDNDNDDNKTDSSRKQQEEELYHPLQGLLQSSSSLFLLSDMIVSACTGQNPQSRQSLQPSALASLAESEPLALSNAHSNNNSQTVVVVNKNVRRKFLRMLLDWNVLPRLVQALVVGNTKKDNDAKEVDVGEEEEEEEEEDVCDVLLAMVNAIAYPQSSQTSETTSSTLDALEEKQLVASLTTSDPHAVVRPLLECAAAGRGSTFLLADAGGGGGGGGDKGEENAVATATATRRATAAARAISELWKVARGSNLPTKKKKDTARATTATDETETPYSSSSSSSLDATSTKRETFAQRMERFKREKQQQEAEKQQQQQQQVAVKNRLQEWQVTPQFHAVLVECLPLVVAGIQWNEHELATWKEQQQQQEEEDKDATKKPPQQQPPLTMRRWYLLTLLANIVSYQPPACDSPTATATTTVSPLNVLMQLPLPPVEWGLIIPPPAALGNFKTTVEKEPDKATTANNMDTALLFQGPIYNPWPQLVTMLLRTHTRSDLYHLQFYQLWLAALLQKDESTTTTLPFLLQRCKFLTLLLHDVGSGSNSAVRGMLWQCANALRLARDSLPPQAFLSRYLASHDGWKEWEPELRRITVEQCRVGGGADIPQRPTHAQWPIPSSAMEVEIDLGSDLAVQLGFPKSLQPWKPQGGAAAAATTTTGTSSSNSKKKKQKKKKRKKKKKKKKKDGTTNGDSSSLSCGSEASEEDDDDDDDEEEEEEEEEGDEEDNDVEGEK